VRLGTSVRRSVVKKLIDAGLIDGSKIKISGNLDVDDDYYQEFCNAYMAFKQTEGLAEKTQVVSDEIERFRQEHGFKYYEEAQGVYECYSAATQANLCKGRPLFVAIKEFIRKEIEPNTGENKLPRFNKRNPLPEPDLRFMQLSLNYASFALLQRDCYEWYKSIVDTEEYFYNWVHSKELFELMRFRYSDHYFRKVFKFVQIINMIYDTSLAVSYAKKRSYIRADLSFMVLQLRFLWGNWGMSGIRRYFMYSLLKHAKYTTPIFKKIFKPYKMSYGEWYELCKLKLDLHSHPKKLPL